MILFRPLQNCILLSDIFKILEISYTFLFKVTDGSIIFKNVSSSIYSTFDPLGNKKKCFLTSSIY